MMIPISQLRISQVLIQSAWLLTPLLLTLVFGVHSAFAATNTASAGTRLDFTLTGANNCRLALTPLNNPGLAYTENGTLANTGPIDWIQFEMYDGASDPTNSGTDFFISKLTITAVQPIPPAILVEPVSRALYTGRTARFSAVAVGTSLSYQWRKNGANLSNGGNTAHVIVDGTNSKVIISGN